jgi:tripartite-type tricarboxylate transporter receptor subunit TctC
LFAPAGTPPDIVRRLHAETIEIHAVEGDRNAPDQAKARASIPMTPEQLGEFVKAEIAKWAPVVKAIRR